MSKEVKKAVKEYVNEFASYEMPAMTREECDSDKEYDNQLFMRALIHRFKELVSDNTEMAKRLKGGDLNALLVSFITLSHNLDVEERNRLADEANKIITRQQKMIDDLIERIEGEGEAWKRG